MKFITICDTHGSLSVEKLEELEPILKQYEHIFILGDIDVFLIAKLKEIAPDKVYGVYGNHDSINYIETHSIQDIGNKNTKIGKFNIAAFHGSWKYKDNGVSPLLISDEESIAVYKTLQKADILFSHDSVKNLYANENGTHPGLAGITKYVKKHKPKFSIHGHFHENSNTWYKKTNIISVYGIVGFEFIHKNDKVHLLNQDIIFEIN